MQPSIPLYSLYGQQIGTAVGLRFLHLESLESSNRVFGWNIRPHRHNDLHQLIWVERGGGGSVMLDDEVLSLHPPVLLNIPSLIVHGFRWEPGSEGLVLTLADSFVADLCHQSDDALVAGLLDQLLVVNGDADPGCELRLRGLFDAILDEYIHDRACRGTAIAGSLLTLFAEIARYAQARQDSVRERGAKALYRRFRELVEMHFRDRWSVARYAQALATTERSLRRLSLGLAGASPGQVVQQRLLLEAKRNLLYTDQMVAEIGYALGFEDPAYFTRFFTRNTGETPMAFRTARGQADRVPPAADLLPG